VPAVLGSLALGRQVFRLVQNALSEARRYYPVEVAFGDQRVRLRALLDTGNHLRDPVLQVPVMVVDYEGLAPCLPEPVRLAFEQGGGSARPDAAALPGNGVPRVDPEDLLDALDGTPWASRLRLIPFSSVGRRGGILVGFRPDAVYYWDGERMVAATQALVGVYSYRLDEAGRYNALLSPDILTSA
ncbi:MAG: sigma-E processing peptidase SpoIIGA, partial [Bacillota bacterium]